MKIEERGRKLTFGSKGDEDSGFVDWSAGECSTERSFEVTESEKWETELGWVIYKSQGNHQLVCNE